VQAIFWGPTQFFWEYLKEAYIFVKIGINLLLGTVEEVYNAWVYFNWSLYGLYGIVWVFDALYAVSKGFINDPRGYAEFCSRN
jgi:hypothetical protein